MASCYTRVAVEKLCIGFGTRVCTEIAIHAYALVANGLNIHIVHS